MDERGKLWTFYRTWRDAVAADPGRHPARRPTLVARRTTNGIAGRFTAMTIREREWKKGKLVGFEVDIRFTYPDGTPFRRRIKAPVESKSAAKRWGEAKERELLLSPAPPKEKPAAAALEEVPTLEEFWPTFIDRYCKAERQKPSTVATKEWAFKRYIRPTLGSKRLDAIGPRDVQDLKAALSDKSPKTSNNVLTVLSACLKVASAEGLKGHEGLGIIDAPPRVRMLRARLPEMAFYETPSTAPAVGRTLHGRAHGARDPSGRGCRATPRRDPRPSLEGRGPRSGRAARPAERLGGAHRHAQERQGSDAGPDGSAP
jgi:hypothetical protein